MTLNGRQMVLDHCGATVLHALQTIEDRVFVSGWETFKDVPPLNCDKMVAISKKS